MGEATPSSSSVNKNLERTQASIGETEKEQRATSRTVTTVETRRLRSRACDAQRGGAHGSEESQGDAVSREAKPSTTDDRS